MTFELLWQLLRPSVRFFGLLVFRPVLGTSGPSTTMWGGSDRLENLRILCPNCHTQTRNFNGKDGKGQEGVGVCAS